jgi:predicted RND superfamily exporter protein
LALTLGVAFCMVAALVFLPAVLQLRDRRRLRHAGTVKDESRSLAKAA